MCQLIFTKSILMIYTVDAEKKSFEHIKELTDKLNVPNPQKCASAKGLIRYMIHFDNPDKVQ